MVVDGEGEGRVALAETEIGDVESKFRLWADKMRKPK